MLYGGGAGVEGDIEYENILNNLDPFYRISSVPVGLNSNRIARQ
jgi:hypothetical protein